MREKQRILDKLFSAAKEAFDNKNVIGRNAYDEIKSTISTLYGADKDIEENVYSELNKIEDGKEKAAKKEKKGGVKYGESTLGKNDFGESQKKTPAYNRAASSGLAKDVWADVQKSGAKEILTEKDDDSKKEEDIKDEETQNEIIKIVGILETSNDDLILKHGGYDKVRNYIKGLFEIELPEKEDPGMAEMRIKLNERGEKLNEEIEATT